MHLSVFREGFRRLVCVIAAAAVALASGVCRAGGQDAPGSSDAGQPEAPKERDVLIILRNGQRVRGVLVRETRDEVTVRIARVETRIARDQIAQIVPQISLTERYREMRAVIEDNDAERLLALVEWLRSQGLLDEALEEVSHVLAIEPDNGEAIRLLRLVEEQIALRAKASPDPAPETEEATTPSERTRRPRPGEFPLLSPEEINLLKVYEVDLDHPPRMLIDRETVDLLLEQGRSGGGVPATREGRAAFHARPPAEILRTMFDLRARDLYGRVRVLGVPSTLRPFRDEINTTWLVNNCATTRCHGGEEAGRLLLFNRSPAAEASFLTNFLIVDQFRFEDGTGLIDYANPERSALLQMGLPRTDSLTPHPDVHGWTPVFRSTDDRRFRQAVEWIRGLHRPRPEIPIDYSAPRWAPSEAPTAPTPPVARPSPEPAEAVPTGPDR